MIEVAIRPADDHYPQTGLICSENTHNRGGGNIYPSTKCGAFMNLRNRGSCRHLDDTTVERNRCNGHC
ncbi:MAG: hypothetical protein R3C26_23485 [Calditrichia bacterium]